MSRWGGVPPEEFRDYEWVPSEAQPFVKDDTWLDYARYMLFLRAQAPKKTFREQLEEEFKNIGWNW